MNRGAYYHHSGQFSLSRVLLGTAAAVGVGSILAVIYAALVLYIPLAGFITFLLAVGFGVGLGVVSFAALQWANVRHEGIAFLSAAVSALASFYVAWTSWTWMVLRGSDIELSLAALLTEPGTVWSLVTEINAVGAWSISDFSPSGAVLWVLWGLEALLVLIPAVLMPMGVLDVPFCERCERWCEATNDVARLAHAHLPDLKEKAEAMRFDTFAQLGFPAAHADEWIRADLHHCPTCGNLHTLSLTEVKVQTDKDGDRNETQETFVKNLLLGIEDAQRVRALNDEAPEPEESHEPVGVG